MWAAARPRPRAHPNANLRLRIVRPHSASRLFGEALEELSELRSRMASAGGDGFVDRFPAEGLAALFRAKLGRPLSPRPIGEADWSRSKRFHAPEPS